VNLVNDWSVVALPLPRPLPPTPTPTAPLPAFPVPTHGEIPSPTTALLAVAMSTLVQRFSVMIAGPSLLLLVMMCTTFVLQSE
jgi:hypothetical protein